MGNLVWASRPPDITGGGGAGMVEGWGGGASGGRLGLCGGGGE